MIPLSFLVFLSTFIFHSLASCLTQFIDKFFMHLICMHAAFIVWFFFVECQILIIQRILSIFQGQEAGHHLHWAWRMVWVVVWLIKFLGVTNKPGNKLLCATTSRFYFLRVTWFTLVKHEWWTASVRGRTWHVACRIPSTCSGGFVRTHLSHCWRRRQACRSRNLFRCVSSKYRLQLQLYRLYSTWRLVRCPVANA